MEHRWGRLSLDGGDQGLVVVRQELLPPLQLLLLRMPRLALDLASSANGSVEEIASLRQFGMLLIEEIVITLPLTSRMRMVTGQRTSIESPSDPAKTASVPLVVGNGQERTAS